MNLLYCDLSWTVVFLLMLTTAWSSILDGNNKKDDTKPHKPSGGCCSSEPIKVPIQDMQIEMDELFKVEKAFKNIDFSSDNEKEYKYFNIDILAIADYPIYHYFMERYNNSVQEARSEIQKHLAFIIFGAKRLYLRNEFLMMGMYKYKIVLNLVDIIIIDSPGESVLYDIVESGNMVDADQGLDLISEHVLELDEPFDHVAYFTGYDLFSRKWGEVDPSAVGLAWVGTMCGKWSVSLIEDDYSGQPMLTFAHELGHSLGTEHDGTNNTCSGEDMFLMHSGKRRYRKNIPNQWTFSHCSKKAISAFILKQIKDNSYLYKYVRKKKECVCFQNKLPIRKSVPDVSKRFHGSEMNLTAQCLIQGHGPPDKCQDFRRSCSVMFCIDSNSNWLCNAILPLRGTSCGDGKVCEAAHCQNINHLRLLKTNFSSKLTAPCGSHCLQVCRWNLVLVTLMICGILAG